jgi:hypothetical protein
VASCREAPNADALNVDAKFTAVRRDMAKRCPAVFEGYGKGVFGCKAVADIDDH